MKNCRIIIIENFRVVLELMSIFNGDKIINVQKKLKNLFNDFKDNYVAVLDVKGVIDVDVGIVVAVVFVQVVDEIQNVEVNVQNVLCSVVLKANTKLVNQAINIVFKVEVQDFFNILVEISNVVNVTDFDKNFSHLNLENLFSKNTLDIQKDIVADEKNVGDKGT